jgi:hypothetical protein
MIKHYHALFQYEDKRLSKREKRVPSNKKKSAIEYKKGECSFFRKNP